ncbi:MAG: hypothetical protein HC923_06755 [Myxococcales bacterium]|nr:hypothetical protein [Myxococcales bacterium]
MDCDSAVTIYGPDDASFDGDPSDVRARDLQGADAPPIVRETLEWTWQ